MDNNNQQQNTDPYQQGNPYRQQNTDPYQQGNPYRQPDPYSGGYGGYYDYGSSQEPQKAPNIFQQFVLSFIPPQYDRLAKVKTGSMIGFVMLLALVATIISFVSLIMSFAPGVDGKVWTDYLPDFEVSDGRLYIEEDFVYDESGAFIYLTDKISGFSYEDVSAIAEEGYRNLILAGRDRISVFQNGEYQQFNFRNLSSDIELSKDWIVNTFMPVMMVLIALGYLFFFVGRVFWYFLCAAIYLLIAMIFDAMMHKKLPSGTLFRVAVYSKVLMFVVATLLSVVPFVTFSVNLFLRIAITIAFMGFAIAKFPGNAGTASGR